MGLIKQIGVAVSTPVPVPGGGNGPTVNVDGTQVPLSALLANRATQFLQANLTTQGAYCTQPDAVGHDAATCIFVHRQGAVPRAPQTPPPVYQTDSAVVVQKEVFGLPEGTLHAHALNTAAAPVGFVAYPDEEFRIPDADMDRLMRVPKAHLTRLFLGQLPYAVTDMQLQWLCYTFGHGTDIVFPERITKKDPMNRNAMVPTGCVHAYCHPDQAEALMDGMHKRLLIDDTGVWHARTGAELATMCAHTAVMKKDRTQRHRNRPYDTVTAQLATSTFVVRPPPSYVAGGGNGPTVNVEVPAGSFAEHNNVCPRTPPPQYQNHGPPFAVQPSHGVTPPPFASHDEAEEGEEVVLWLKSVIVATQPGGRGAVGWLG